MNRPSNAVFVTWNVRGFIGRGIILLAQVVDWMMSVVKKSLNGAIDGKCRGYPQS
jgi:hypothetical protein